MKTQQEAEAYIATVKLPPGWHILAFVLRAYKFRSTFALYLIHDGEVVRHAAYNQVEPAVRSMVATAERVGRAQVITADMDGWVRDWSDA